MNELRSIYGIGKTEVLYIVRQLRFNIILIIIMIISSYFIPSKTATFGAMYFDGYRGIYDSVWIGNIIAFTSSVFISLFGFYIVKNSIVRDRKMRIDELIKSSSLKLSTYLHGKALGNFMVLIYISSLMMIVGMITQIIRGEVQTIQIYDYLIPFLFFSIPVIIVTSIIAVLFDCIPQLQNTMGSIVYFFLFLVNFSVFLATQNNFIDLYGCNIIIPHIIDAIKSIEPSYVGSVSIFYGGNINYLASFNLSQIHWTDSMIFSRCIFILDAYVILWISIFIYARIYKKDTDNHVKSMNIASFIHEGQIEKIKIYNTREPILLYKKMKFSTEKFDFLYLFLLDLKIKLMDEKVNYLLFLIAITLLTYLMPISIAWDHIYAFLWLFILPFLSRVCLYDSKKRTDELLRYNSFAHYRILSNYLSSIFMLILVSSGIILKLILSGNLMAVSFIISNIFLIPSLSLLISQISRTSKVFEIIFLFWWYVGTINNSKVFDFTGYSLNGEYTLLWSLINVLVSLLCISFAYLINKHVISSH